MPNDIQKQTTAWLLLTKTDRTHAGNEGYGDDLASSYTWDNTVPNFNELQEGDTVAIWDGKRLLGISVAEHIYKEDSTKPRHRCPNCSTTDIRRRKNSSQAYRCANCKIEFDKPSTEQLEVTTYRTDHWAAWRSIKGLIMGVELRSVCVNPKSQHSMRLLDHQMFQNLLEKHSEKNSLNLVMHVQTAIKGGHKKATAWVRVGQGKFRQDLLDKYGDNCAVSGPAPREAIQASHLYSFAKSGKHESQGGILLRSDLHTLFDRGLLKIDPKSEKVFLDPTLKKFSTYWLLNDVPMKISISSKQKVWLRTHWDQNPFKTST